MGLPEHCLEKAFISQKATHSGKGKVENMYIYLNQVIEVWKAACSSNRVVLWDRHVLTTVTSREPVEKAHNKGGKEY